VVGSCEHGNETSGFMKGREFLCFSRRTVLRGVGSKSRV
jgi:hypothetical protein